MITAIEIENFKAFGDRVRVPLRPLTLVFGPNSAGKSTILQALHYAQELFQRHNLSPDRTYLGGDTMDLGGFRNFVHGHDTNLPVRIRLDLQLDKDGLPKYPRPFESEPSDCKLDPRIDELSSAWAEVEVSGVERDKPEEIRKYSVGFDGAGPFATITQDSEYREAATTALDIAPKVAGKDRQKLQDLLNSINTLEVKWCHPLLAKGGRLQELRDLDGIPQAPVRLDRRRMRGSSDPSALPEWSEYLGVSFEGHTPYDCSDVGLALSRLVVGPGELATEYLQELRYLGPLRALPPREFKAQRQHDPTRWWNGLAAWDALGAGDDVMVGRVNEWLSRLQAGYLIRLQRYREVYAPPPPPNATPEELQRFAADARHLAVKTKIVLEPAGSGLEVLPHDVGVGISQLLPAIVLALESQKGLVAIEQPELHLHPALQAELGDLFIESALGENKNRIILETHSEHLILRVLRRVRETTDGELPVGYQAIRPEDVSVLYVQPGAGGAEVVAIPVTGDGEFAQPWPKGFFPERARELF